jgi:1-acyl-sn-glycerol-3-phosphate acyltransferase
MHHPADLLRDRRFWPLFWAQFLGSFNDNLLKNAIVILIVYQGLKVWGMDGEAMATFAPALLILPYFLFSSLAGQLADKYPKSWLIRRVKLAEVALMGVAAAGFLLGVPQALLVVLFCIGMQATFFGPMKYSALPQYLEKDELVAGNALVEGATNLSILFGTIAGGLLIAMTAPIPGTWVVAAAVVGCAFVGWLCTLRLVDVPAEAPDLVMDWNPFTTTWRMCARAAEQRGVWNAILAISWFWTVGFAFLALFVPWAKDVLHADAPVVTLFLALFSIGVGVGSILCERLSFDRLELGLVPLGSIGLSLFAFDLALASGPAAAAAPAAGAALQGVAEFLAKPTSWRIVADLTLLSVSAGIFIVPLYTCMQTWSEPAERSRVIAVNNILNALFIVGYAGIQIALLAYLTVPQIFALLAGVNALVALYIYAVIPDFTLRFVAYMLTRVGYRLRVFGAAHVPEAGPAVVVANHVSFVDWLFIAGALQRPPRFVMWAGFAKHPLMRALIDQARIIPIASAKEDPEALARAMDQIAAELEAGELVCIFPEGRITGDGAMNEFKPGIERIVARTPVPVVPLGLRGLWGSYFSRKDGPALSKPFRRGFWSPVTLVFGEPVPPEQVTAAGLQAQVAALVEGGPGASMARLPGSPVQRTAE